MSLLQRQVHTQYSVYDLFDGHKYEVDKKGSNSLALARFFYTKCMQWLTKTVGRFDSSMRFTRSGQSLL